MRITHKILAAMWQTWWADHRPYHEIQTLQTIRLSRLVNYARTRSGFYGRKYADLPWGRIPLTDLPPVTKPELMEAFDDWVTDPALKRSEIEAFINDPSKIGQPYLGKYSIWRTSGITGRPGVFVQDAQSIATYIAVLANRGYVKWLGLWRALTFVALHWRLALVVAARGHFAANGFFSFLQNLWPGTQKHSLILSVLTPLPDLVSGLNAFQPAIIGIYPTALHLLTQEQTAGRLKIKPRLIVTGGEWLSPTQRSHAATVFGCPVKDTYGASEFMGIAFDCDQGRLHLNAEWAILEPVDDQDRPVPPGQPSQNTLFTNLANRTQPLIRYALGDSITMFPDACPCGSSLPSFQVEGRRSEILHFARPDGRSTPIMPLAATSILIQVPGLNRFQIIQTGPMEIHVRMEVMPGADPQQVWARASTDLRGFLHENHLDEVALEWDTETPKTDPVSGKFKQLWAEFKAPERTPA